MPRAGSVGPCPSCAGRGGSTRGARSRGRAAVGTSRGGVRRMVELSDAEPLDREPRVFSFGLVHIFASVVPVCDQILCATLKQLPGVYWTASNRYLLLHNIPESDVPAALFHVLSN